MEENMSYNHKEHCEPIQNAYEKMLTEGELLAEVTLTRKHFEHLAAIIKANNQYDGLAEGLIAWASSLNPQFDETRFRKAAGMKE
jgi:hypothetical protein